MIIKIATIFALTLEVASQRKMTAWLFLIFVVVFVVAHRPTTISAQPLDSVNDVVYGGNDEAFIETGSTPAGIRNFVGIGYNIIDGNPEGGDLLGGVDPGLLTNRPILHLTYDQQIISQDGFLLPDQVFYTIRQSLDKTQETFYGTKSYVEKVQNDIEESHNVQGIFSKVKFSGSSRYSDVAASIDAFRYVYYEEREVNLYAEARYRLELADSEEWPLDEGFVAAACSELTPTFHNTTYFQFIDKWGTHVVTEVDLGSKSATRHEETTQGFVHYAHSEVSGSVSFQANLFPGFKGGVVVDMERFSDGFQIGMSFGSKTHTFTAGGEEYPEPIGMCLSGMHEIFDIAYWRRFEDYVSNGRCDPDWINHLDTIAANMENALKNYAVWKNAQESKDPLVGIPITWPKGTYGLPMPEVGCPENGFTWAEGWRYQDTEGVFPDNRWSNPCHLKGPYWENNMYSNFCMKTRAEEDIYDWPFQPGVYCVYKKGSCPEGLEEGFVYWDDDEPHFANDNAIWGEIPDGYYDYNTFIYYCCRTDGYASNPIYLPTDKPFFLMKYNHQCQEVYGMKVTPEYFRWDTTDVGPDDDHGGAHPYPGVVKGDDIIIEYCYYEPED